ERNGVAINRSAQRLMDDIIVPAWDGFEAYPSVKVRMDFREPTTEGIFVYHCHILGHEDQGMMAEIEVGNTTVSAGTRLIPSLFSPFIAGTLGLFSNLFHRLFMK
ncbi:MAG TPA: multicopper oxidase domain-containing protein, partial [Myxococcota bacterium]|nr:multicopper oxidase domain-containing protein [Myxococcota bacterium]